MKDINKNTIQTYIAKLRARGESASVVKRKMKSVEKFVGWAKSKGYAKEEEYREMIKALESPGLFKKAAAFIGRWKMGMEAGQDDRNKKIEKNPSSTDQLPNPFPNLPSNFGLQHYIGLIIILIFMAVMGAGIYNQFFAKVRGQFAYPTALTRAGRILSFQGRLTDILNNPITTATNVTFKLYSVSPGGTALYNTGACSVTPDQDGIFSRLIGSECGAEINNAIFTENTNIYLGVTVASDAEMTPRQQIANVGYAINAETLQGLPPGANTSNIPYINVDGNLLIAAANPGMRSTYASSTFTISSAQATTIQSAGTGDIVLQATESGTLRFRTGGATDTYTRLFVDTSTNSGNVGIGTTAPGAKLEVAGQVKITGGAPGANKVLTSDTVGLASWTDVSSTAGPWTLSGSDLYPDSTSYNVGIGTTSPAVTSLLDLTSTTKGFLAPRMT
ncbi:MAG: hypothetical protein Q7U68_07145, partial [Candidatus Roizmanbacteria bacterium]|nr:hypothetical protein [Candidatus Roizmanbacteria bacterium]